MKLASQAPKDFCKCTPAAAVVAGMSAWVSAMRRKQAEPGAHHTSACVQADNFMVDSVMSTSWHQQASSSAQQQMQAGGNCQQQQLTCCSQV
jgi:hypothetical protein